jgi:EmrB/QacA subfamily drug resistance transporter
MTGRSGQTAVVRHAPAASARPARKPADPARKPANPWRALWAMMVGFFMILVDSTIVAVANPSIMDKLNANYAAVIWVTSAYLLAYAVPLLIAGRLGDRFGPKNLYLLGLTVFTLASLWCGLSGSIGMLIVARVVQGIGAALLTPQTLSTITRIFPPERRGAAMSLWGATAGVATLVGPLVGGVLVDSLGWQWIFFVNVPVGVIGLGLAVWLVPVLSTNKHGFDVFGVLLSGVAMFLIVFGLQEGQSHHWSAGIWGMIAGGVAVMLGFVYWQSINKHEPLIPLSIFRDRDFSLSNIAIAVIGFTVTAMVLPVVFYAQAVCGLSPTRSALLIAPMAIGAGVLAPAVGKIVDRAHPRSVIGFGFSTLAIGLTWLSIEMTPTTPIWRLVLPLAVMGVGMAFIWAPLGATATRHLPPPLAGAGSGVYNATRQVGSVLGSASMAAFMTARINAELPPTPNGAPSSSRGSVTRLPDFLHEPFSAAMSQSILLPAFVALFGVVAALFLLGFGGTTRARARAPARARGRGIGAGLDDPSEARTDELPLADEFAVGDDPYRRDYSPVGRAPVGRAPVGTVPARSTGYQRPGYDEPGYDEPGYGEPGYDEPRYGEPAYQDSAYEDEYYDDDDYVEYAVSFPELDPPVDDDPADGFIDESDTAPLAVHADHRLRGPAGSWPHEPAEPRHSLDDAAPRHAVEPIGFARNGVHVDDEHRFRPLTEPDSASGDGTPPPTRAVNGNSVFSAEFAALWAAANTSNGAGRSDYDTGYLGSSRPDVSADYFRSGADHYGGESGDHLLGNGSSSRHQMPEPDEPPFGVESEDPATYGRHAMPGRD